MVAANVSKEGGEVAKKRGGGAEEGVWDCKDGERVAVVEVGEEVGGGR